jgi:hypothetical protein
LQSVVALVAVLKGAMISIVYAVWNSWVEALVLLVAAEKTF